MADQSTTIDTPAPATTIHDVVGGENPGTIAQKYGTTVQALQSANPQYAQFVSNPNYIQAGWKLNIPGAPAPASAPAPVAPTQLNIDTSKEPTSDTLTKFTSMDDIKKLLDDNQAAISSTLTPTDSEKKLQQQLADIRASEANASQGLKEYQTNLQGEGISSGAIQGRSLDAERGVNLTLERMGIQEKNLLTRLGLEQDARTVAEKIATNKYGETKDLIDYAAKAQAALDKKKTDLATAANVLTDNARQSLQVILTEFKGMDYHSLSPDAQNKLQSISQQSGIPIGVIIQGMQVQKTQQDLDNLNKQKQLNIEQQNANRLLADDTKIPDQVKSFQDELSKQQTELNDSSSTKSDRWATAYNTLKAKFGSLQYPLSDGTLVTTTQRLNANQITELGGNPKVDQTLLDIMLNKSENYKK